MPEFIGLQASASMPMNLNQFLLDDYPMIDWQSIDTVFLDMDGTLLDLNFDNHFWLDFVPARYAEQQGLSLAAAKTQLQPRFKAMQGQLEWYCLDYWSRELHLDLAGLKAEVAGLISVLPHVVEFLEFLRGLPLRVVLATNAHPKSLGLKLERTRLGDFFDRIVSSHQFGHAKEQPAFWEHLQALEPFSIGRTLLVDDSLPVLRAARDYGVAHTIAVLKSDSRQPARDAGEFPAIHDFRELLP
jgi:5'-nucleotidase